jgi:DNA repair exonuclease SbcCD ATPase subunit
LLDEHKLAEWEKLKHKLDAQELEIAASEEKLTAVQPPTQTEDELQQAVSDFEAFDAALNELRPLIDSAKEKVAQFGGEIKAIQDRCQRLKEEIADITVTAADAHLSTKKLEAIREAVLTRQSLEEQRLKLKYEKDTHQKQYETVLQQEAEAVSLRKWVAVAETAREALKNAPRLVAQRNLKRLETSINELLQIFGVNFFVTVAEADSPTFIAEFYDGRKQTAQRLSIGQKTVLALAFRVAVNAQFAEEIGLLALDEPTASLDAPRIKALAPVLEKLRDLSTTKGLQCLLVTHATALSHLFESTIELEPPELRHASAR